MYNSYGVQYRMPDAYDLEGGINQEKRFSVAMQRYRSDYVRGVAIIMTLGLFLDLQTIVLD